MALVAVISRVPLLSPQEWLRCIDTRVMAAPDVVEVTNPFTGVGRLSVRPQPGEVVVLVDGQTVGGIEPSVEFERDGELHVYAPAAPSTALRDVVRETANRLGANVEWAE
jgi:hypothetical protein